VSRSHPIFRVLFHAVILVMISQSLGLLCDDCMLASATESCRHGGDDEHANGAASFSDPCANSLCSLCGFALPRKAPSIALHRCLCATCHMAESRYRYLPISGLFRPPRARSIPA